MGEGTPTSFDQCSKLGMKSLNFLTLFFSQALPSVFSKRLLSQCMYHSSQAAPLEDSNALPVNTFSIFYFFVFFLTFRFIGVLYFSMPLTPLKTRRRQHSPALALVIMGVVYLW